MRRDVVSIHALVMSATLNHLPLTYSTYVSIHALVMSATGDNAYLGVRIDVSIHALVMSATQLIIDGNRYYLFQSTRS